MVVGCILHFAVAQCSCERRRQAHDSLASLGHFLTDTRTRMRAARPWTCSRTFGERTTGMAMRSASVAQQSPAPRALLAACGRQGCCGRLTACRAHGTGANARVQNATKRNTEKGTQACSDGRQTSLRKQRFRAQQRLREMRLNAVAIADDGHMRHRTSSRALAGVASKVIHLSLIHI